MQMAKDDVSGDPGIHVVPARKEWDGTFPVHINTRAALDRYFNRRKLEKNTTRHHRREADIHVIRKLGDISKCCGES